VTSILVTGGAGLIGSHLVDRLLERGERVRVLDNLDAQTHPEGRPAWIPPDVEFLHGDVQDRSMMERALAGVDEVYHQAAFGGFTNEISRYYDANTTGTAMIFDVIASRGLDVRKVVAASSQAIYGEGLYVCPEHGTVQPGMRDVARLRAGEWESRCPICDHETAPTLTHEDARWNGETPYAVSKLAEERTVLGMGRRLGLPTVALRYAVTFGPRQSVFNPYTGVVSIFSTLLLNGRRPVVYEDGRQTRDFIFVGDIVEANLHVMADERANGQPFNVGRGEPVAVADLVQALGRGYGVDGSFELTGEFRPGDNRHIVHDSSRLRSLGWEPKVSLEDALAATCNWIRGLGELEDRFTDAVSGLREGGVVQASESA
jgi:dTDP-L-rhamnose 4-epimerase